MAKILVTGGAGFIGSNLVEDIIKDDNEIVIVDDLSMGLESNIPPDSKITFYHKSITDYNFMENLLLTEQFDYIYLLAAVASVADSIARPAYTHEVNQNANLFILETIRKNKLPVKKLLFASSAAIYGDEPTLPKSESSAVRPLTPYAIDKFATERFVVDYGKLYGLNTVAVRFFNVYGPKQNPASPYSGVLSILADRLISHQEFTLFGDGEQTRDFVFVKDVISALRMLMHHESARNDVFNIATGNKTSVNDVIREMQSITGIELNLRQEQEREGDIRDSLANISKLESLGFEPEYSLKDGLNLYLKSL